MSLWKPKKYTPLAPQQAVKFVTNSRYEWEFKKGDLGIVDRVISPYPSATDTVYSVIHAKSKKPMWITGEDIVSLDQLSITDADLESVNVCGHSYFEDTIVCNLGAGHGGLHKAFSDLQWDDEGKTPWDDWADMI